LTRGPANNGKRPDRINKSATPFSERNGPRSRTPYCLPAGQKSLPQNACRPTLSSQCLGDSLSIALRHLAPQPGRPLLNEWTIASRIHGWGKSRIASVQIFLRGFQNEQGRSDDRKNRARGYSCPRENQLSRPLSFNGSLNGTDSHPAAAGESSWLRRERRKTFGWRCKHIRQFGGRRCLKTEMVYIKRIGVI
jgi:hypothetical protein